jgi:hypothetical protein
MQQKPDQRSKLFFFLFLSCHTVKSFLCGSAKICCILNELSIDQLGNIMVVRGEGFTQPQPLPIEGL